MLQIFFVELNLRRPEMRHLTVRVGAQVANRKIAIFLFPAALLLDRG